MEEEDIIRQFPVLHSAYGGLTKSERRIAVYLAVHAGDVLNKKTIAELAEEVSSSEVTISRFCKKLGCSGWQEVKQLLAAELLALPKRTFQDIRADDSVREVAIKIFKNITDGLTDTLVLLDYNAIDEAAKQLLQARRIYVFGFGNSATVCQDIATRFIRLGCAVYAYADSHMQVTAAALLESSDAVLAISHSGASEDLLASVEAAKHAGATVIAITSHARSELTKLADISLCGMGREVQYVSEAGASRLIHMAIGDVLYTRMAMLEREDFHKNIEKMRKEIGKKRV